MTPSNLPAGKSLWDRFLERIRGSDAGGLRFYNPLDLAVGGALEVSADNGSVYADYDFTVSEIREYNRQIGAELFQFTDYVLRGTNTKTFDAADVMAARVRTVPNQLGEHDAVLLRLADEFAFAPEFLAVLNDTTGILEIGDDDHAPKDSFMRINDLRVPYDAAVLVCLATTPDNTVLPAQSRQEKLQFWDYWRDLTIGAGQTAKEFVFVEKNADTGWFQIWRGREYF